MDCKTTAELTTRVVSGNASTQDAAQLRSHVATCAAWYADDFLRLLPVEAGEALAQKTSAQSPA